MSRLQIIITLIFSFTTSLIYLIYKFNIDKKKLIKKQNSRPEKHFRTDAKKIKINTGHLILLAIVVFAVIGYFNANRLVDNVNKNKCISFGRVTKYESLYKSSKGYYYEFYRDNKIYTGFYSFWPNSLPIINKLFPVALDCDDPTNNAILILPKDFEKYNLYFPDSLNWLIQYE